MSVDFKRIKKYSKTSNNFDEKLEHLNKELKKTGLREGMVTGKMYQGSTQVPNQDYINFNGLSQGGYALGLSGADGNSLGNAIIGINPSTGQTGVALSPPHPVTGVRRPASTVLDGVGSNRALRPGIGTRVRGTNDDGSPRVISDGSAVWFFHQPTDQWYNFEYLDGELGFWDTNFLGFFFHNTNLDEFQLSGVSVGTQIKNKIAPINFGANGEIGTPQTTVLVQNELGDPGFLPITIEGLSTQGFNYLKGKAGANVSSSYYSPEDKKNVINYYKKKQADPNYQPKPYERESLMRQMRAQGDDGTQIASTDPSAAFPSAPPDAFEPETVETELTPADIPDEFKIGSNTNTTDESKPTEEGKKVKLTKWMSRTDYMSKYPNTSMVDYLSSLPYGPTDFMTPNPNYSGAWDLNTRGYENYFMNGDLSALGNKSGIPKPRHSTATAEPEKEGKTKEEIIADLDKTIEKYSTMEKEAYAEMRRIALELGMDFVSLIGGLFTGGTTAAPVLGKLGMKLLKKYGKTVAGKMIRKLIKKFRNKKNSKQLDKIIDDIEKGGNESGVAPEPDLDLVQEPARPPVSPKPKPKPGEPGSQYDAKGRKRFIPKVDPLRGSGLFDSNKLDKEKLLSEAAKLGHFEPEVLNVNIDDLRKGIAPEFPKDPPPEMIDGYSVKSRLAPKKIEGSPFINITKKDLARNHKLTDKEISDFMNDINMINDYIKKNPADLIYAQERYPKHDPRLAQLNWQMDQMLDAGKEYIDKQFPENQKLFNRIKKKIKNTIDQTDPKNFKDTKLPKFDNTNIEDFKRKKEVYSRFMKKPVETKNSFHLDMKDVKKRHLKKLTVRKLKEQKDREEKKIIQEISKKYKADWKREIYEGMNTSDAQTITVAPVEGDGTVTTVDAIDDGNYSNLDINAKPVKMFAHIGQEGGVGDDGVFDSAFVGTVIRDSGSGTGSDGGFDVGGKYLAFQGTGAPNNNARFASLGAIDSTKIDTLTITAIVGNDNNGGETPDLQAECLFLLYKTPAMDRSTLLHITPDVTVGEGDGVIIKTPLDGQGGRLTNNGGLNNYSITIPEYARTKGTNFILYQNFNSGSAFDNYGITDIKFQRKTPLSVVVSLDDPDAISFVRVGSNEGDPKKRKKKLNDQLAASDEYTSSVLGNQFPGEGARVDGEDPFKSAPLTPDDVINASPIGKDEVKKSFGDFTDDIEKQRVAEVEKLTGELDNLLKQNKYNYADPKIIQIADKILKTDPKNEDAYFYKIGAQYQTGDMEGVAKTTDELIKNNPDDTIGYSIRSSLRKDEGDLFGAIEDLEKVIELDPDETYYQDMKRELENESDDDVQSKLDDYVTKSIPEPSKPVDDSKPTEAGRGIKLTKWISRTDYRDMYPNTSVVDYLRSLPYGATDFMTPNPKYPGAWDLNRKGYENYFLNGDLSALGNRSGTPKPRHTTATPEPEPAPETDFSDVPKTSEQILADLDATIAKYSAAEQAAYAEMKRIALEFGLDVISLVGGLFTGGTSLAGSPTLSKLLLKLAKKSGKGLFGKLVRNVLRRTQKADVYSVDDIPDFIDQQTSNYGLPTPKPKPKQLPAGQVPAGDVGSIDPVTGLPRGGAGQNIGLPDVDKRAYDRQTSYSLDPILGKIDKKKKKPKFNVGLDYGRGADGNDVIYYNSYRSDGTTLFERLKQKQFFNPNDIKPTFPENPPPQLDPKTGMHPNYGKNAKRYRKLDPASANAMPPTGDPETDAIVDKQRTKPKTKLYDKLKKNIRKDLTNK